MTLRRDRSATVPRTTSRHQCTPHIEYGNSLSFMGGGAHHPSALHKYHAGLDERLQRGQGRRSDDDHAGAAGAALQRRAAAADPGAEDARAGPGTARRPRRARRRCSALLPRDARAVRLRQRHRPDGADLDRPRAAGAERAAPYLYLLDITPEHDDAQQRRPAGGRRAIPIRRGGLTFTRHCDRQDQRDRHHHDDGDRRADLRRRHAVHGAGARTPTSCGPLFGGGRRRASRGSGGGAGGRGGAAARPARGGAAARRAQRARGAGGRGRQRRRGAARIERGGDRRRRQTGAGTRATGTGGDDRPGTAGSHGAGRRLDRTAAPAGVGATGTGGRRPSRARRQRLGRARRRRHGSGREAAAAARATRAGRRRASLGALGRCCSGWLASCAGGPGVRRWRDARRRSLACRRRLVAPRAPRARTAPSPIRRAS